MHTLFQQRPLIPAPVTGLRKQLAVRVSSSTKLKFKLIGTPSIGIMLPAPFSTRLKSIRVWCLWRNSASACVSLTVVVEAEVLLEWTSWSSAGPHGLTAVHFHILKQYSCKGGRDLTALLIICSQMLQSYASTLNSGTQGLLENLSVFKWTPGEPENILQTLLRFVRRVDLEFNMTRSSSRRKTVFS